MDMFTCIMFNTSLQNVRTILSTILARKPGEIIYVPIQNVVSYNGDTIEHRMNIGSAGLSAFATCAIFLQLAERTHAVHAELAGSPEQVARYCRAVVIVAPAPTIRLHHRAINWCVSSNPAFLFQSFTTIIQVLIGTRNESSRLNLCIKIKVVIQ